MSRFTDDHIEGARSKGWTFASDRWVETVDALRAEVESLTTQRDEARADHQDAVKWWSAAVTLAEAAVARAEQAEAERNTYRRLVDDLIAERDALAKVILEHAPVMTLTAAEDAIVGRALSGEEGPQ